MEHQASNHKYNNQALVEICLNRIRNQKNEDETDEFIDMNENSSRRFLYLLWP